MWLPAASKSPMPELGWGGVLPFTWRPSTAKAFEVFSADGAPTVAPIIQIIMSRAPDATRAWVERLAAWPVKQVVPAHFDAPLAVGPGGLRKAFGFLDARNEGRFCDEDVRFLREALEGLPPDLALFPTPLGEIRGRPGCGLLPEGVEPFAM